MNSLEKFIEISKGFTEEIQKESDKEKLAKRKLIVNKEIREEIEILSKDGGRKQLPVFSGVLSYFPDALFEVSKCSATGQEQHNPNKPLGWDRSKSGNEYDSLSRHLLDSAKEDFDTDGTLHKAKIAWRALAGLQKHLENNKI